MTFNFKDMMSIYFPIEGTFDIANAALNLGGRSVLDIGLGDGGASLFFALNGKSVTAIGLDIDSYKYPRETLKIFNIDIKKTSFGDFETDKKFDIIWASHILEHNLDVGSFLDKCKTLLSKNGWLCIIVPPFKKEVVGGHLTSGWNLGQLMYVLLVKGFDIKKGHFIKHLYSICGFVQKTDEELPKLRMDIGDIEATSHLWPIEVKQGFDGDIDHINWFKDFKSYEFNKRKIASLENMVSEVVEKIRGEVIQERTRLKTSVPTTPTLLIFLGSMLKRLKFLKKIPVLGKLLLFCKRIIIRY